MNGHSAVFGQLVDELEYFGVSQNRLQQGKSQYEVFGFHVRTRLKTLMFHNINVLLWRWMYIHTAHVIEDPD